MIERVLPGFLLASLLAISAGCCSYPGMFHGGMVAGGCGVGCGPGCLAGHLGGGAGCGEVYVDEWCSDPPAACGPCDYAPQPMGAACCGWWNPLQGLSHLWGYRYSPMGVDAGCATCGETAMMPEVKGKMMLPADQDFSVPPGGDSDSLIPPAPTPVDESQASRAPRRPAPRFTTAGTRQTLRR